MEPRRKYQVFISSTFEDLAEERKQLQETILNMNHFPVGMELFSAASENQWTIITKTIDCSDYYVLIIGYRYGSVTEEGISYTEKEYRYAKDKGIPILVFIREAGGSAPESSFETSPTKKEKLNSFIEEVKTGRLVEWWKTTNDLCNKVMNALYKQFTDTPRPGWIRADTMQLVETQAELLQQNQRIRELEAENDRLRVQGSTRSPSMEVSINDGTSLVLELPVWNERNVILADYMPYDLEEKQKEGYSEEWLKKFQMFNDQLPGQEQMDEYIAARRKFDFAKNHAIPLKIDIRNLGTAKATGIIADLMFPPELCVYTKVDIENLQEPQPPFLPERPEVVRWGGASILHSKLFDEYTNLRSGPRIKLSSIIDSDNNDWIRDNTIHVRRAQIMHTRRCIVSDYFLVPLQTGEFEIQCTIICEELSAEQTFTIPVSVISK